MTRSRFVTIEIACALVALAALLASGAAAAAEPEECPTWFPDFRCERSARYQGFTPPMTAPFLFEDPFITTGLSLWGLWHDFPESGVFEGGDARAFAAQVRVALTDRLGLVATKDGRINHRPDLDLLDTETGYGDLAFGLKYALIDDPDRRFILTPSLRYEATNGSRNVLSGNGEGVWIPAVSIGWGGWELQTLASMGVRIPVDQDEESTVLFYNLHVDRQFWKVFSPFLEVNGYRYIQEGDGSTQIKLGNGTSLTVSQVQGALGLSGFEGLDLVNLGSDDVKNNDVMTWAVGFRLAIRPGVSMGVAYERPLTKRRDILKQRITWNLLLEL